MTKSINFSLYKGVIQSDFFLVNTKILDKKVHFAKKVFFLDIFEVVKELKQFIRNVQLISDKSDIKIVFLIKNKYFYLMLKKYYVNINMSNKIIVQNTLDKSYLLGTSHHFFFVSLEDPNSTYLDMNAKSFTSLNLFFVTRIKLRQSFFCGHYSITKNVLTLKSFIFIISLINQVFTSKN